MRIAVLADVHANLDALETVLAHIAKGPAVDAVYFAGDAVGYGPDPDECVLRLKKECSAFVAGNHDQGFTGQTDTSAFNPLALEALRWSEGKVSDEAVEVLGSWPMTARPEGADMHLVHANPVKPEGWEYIMVAQAMESSFGAFKERLCVLGHSHMAFITELDAEGQMALYGNGPDRVPFKPGARYLINAGSVGQSRDQDPRAAYALIDYDEGMQIVRVEYDVNKTAERMVKVGLHLALSERLRYGF